MGILKGILIVTTKCLHFVLSSSIIEILYITHSWSMLPTFLVLKSAAASQQAEVQKVKKHDSDWNE